MWLCITTHLLLVYRVNPARLLESGYFLSWSVCNLVLRVLVFDEEKRSLRMELSSMESFFCLSSKLKLFENEKLKYFLFKSEPVLALNCNRWVGYDLIWFVLIRIHFHSYSINGRISLSTQKCFKSNYDEERHLSDVTDVFLF